LDKGLGVRPSPERRASFMWWIKSHAAWPPAARAHARELRLKAHSELASVSRFGWKSCASSVPCPFSELAHGSDRRIRVNRRAPYAAFAQTYRY
jgi:hypothetical protein